MVCQLPTLHTTDFKIGFINNPQLDIITRNYTTFHLIFLIRLTEKQKR